MAKFLEIHENDRKSLECPICKDWLVVPKATRCNHIFCEICLTNYLEQHESNAPPCPVCRERIVLPQKGMQGFRTEHFYQSLITRLKDSDDSENVRVGVCGFCKVHLELTTRCLTCMSVICKRCSTIHNTLKPHCTVVPISLIDTQHEDELMSQRNIVCDEHDTELLNLYCVVCNKVICKLCNITSHADHQCESLQTRAKFCRDWLEDINVELTDVIEKARDGETDINNVLTSFLEDLQDAENKGIANIDALIKILTDKKIAFRRRINDKRIDVSSRLQRELNKVASIETEAKTLQEITNKTLRHGADADVATLQNDMISQFENLKRELYSSLDKEFKLNVSFNETDNKQMTESLADYNIGNLECSQTVTTKAMLKTRINPELLSWGYITSNGDSMAMRMFSQKYFMKWICSDISYENTFEKEILTENGKEAFGFLPRVVAAMGVQNEEELDNAIHNGYVVYGIANGNAVAIFKGKKSFPYVHIYSFVATMKNGEIIALERLDGCIHRLSPTGEIIQIIDNAFTKDDVSNGDVNENGEILLVGKEKDGSGYCTVLKPDGSLKLRQTFADGYGEKPINVAIGRFDSMQNIVMRVDSQKSNERVFVLLNVTTRSLEKICLPSIPGVNSVQPSFVCKKCDGLLYMTVNKGSMVLTVGYLP